MARRRSGAAYALVFALLVPLLLHAQDDQRIDVLVAFANAPGPSDEALLRSVGGRVKYRYRLVAGIAANVPRTAVAALQRNPRVRAIEPDLQVSIVDAELDNSWGVKRIGSGTVHDTGIRGGGVRVAIIDTGIDYTHPDLAANYGGGWDFANDDADPFDDNMHGTHVAGSVGASDNDAGVVGVAPEVTLLAVKVLRADGTGFLSDIIAGVQWAVDNRANVTNNSYGTVQNPGLLFQSAFDNAAAAGLLHIAAAGNSGNCAGTGDSVQYPARYASVVAVAATSESDNRACFSSTGPDVELSAPGVDVLSTVPGGSYTRGSGTSMASPHAAGAAALVFSVGPADSNSNGRVNDEVRQILTSTVRDLGIAGRDPAFGFGLVDAAAAVAAVVSPQPPEPAVEVAVSTDTSSYAQGTATAQLTAVVTDEAHAAISGLPASAFVTMMDSAPAGATFVETAVPGTYTAALDISALASGVHAVTLTATDARGLTGSSSTSFSVIAPNIVRVQSITYQTYGGLTGKLNLRISVLVVDEAGAPVSGAIVSAIVRRNGALYGMANSISGANGKALFDAKNAPAGCYQTTVPAVIAGTRVWDGVTPPNQFCK